MTECSHEQALAHDRPLGGKSGIQGTALHALTGCSTHSGPDGPDEDLSASRIARTEGPKTTGNMTTAPIAAKASIHKSLSDQSGQATAPTMQTANTA